MSWTRTHRDAAIILLAAISAGTCSAQSTFATITGTASDPNGALAPGVKVEATHLAPGFCYGTRTHEAGPYTLANLIDGVHTLRATAAGFREFVVENVVLASCHPRRVDVRLQLGAVETVFEASGGAALVETETARRSDIKAVAVLRGLPLSLRRAEYHRFTGGIP